MLAERTKSCVKVLTLLVLMCGFMVGTSLAQEAVEESSIGVDLDMSYFSKFMWRGYDVFDDHAVFQPSAGLASRSWSQYRLAQAVIVMAMV